MKIPVCLCLMLTLGITGCSAPGDDQQDSAQQTKETEPAVEAKAEPSEPVEITWEQLMPEGEEERLADLYANFYKEMNQKRAEASADPEADASDLVAAVVEGSAGDTMDQIGTFNVVSKLDGALVRLPGYVVPFDFSADATYEEFLLVPYFGACLHTPPPPPNQIVYVKAESGANIANIYDPVWVEGVMKTGEYNSELADSAYELTLSKVEAYEY